MAEKIHIVPHSALESGPPTAGMLRSQAFSTENLWMGEVRTRPGLRPAGITMESTPPTAT